MRQFLVAAVALSLCGSALAQVTVSDYESSSSSSRSASAGSNQANTELLLMIEELRREVRSLQGRVEEQRYKLDQLTSQSRERYIDLDQRLLELSRNQPDPQASQNNADTEQGSTASDEEMVQEVREYREPTGQEKADYEAIQALIHDERDYDTAIDRLYGFISEYPEGDLTVNAYYWLGEVYLAKPQLQQAKQAFSIVTSRFADHRKAADALYKLGVTQARLGDESDAEATLSSVPERFPGSNAAGLAEDYLREL